MQIPDNQLEDLIYIECRLSNNPQISNNAAEISDIISKAIITEQNKDN